MYFWVWFAGVAMFDTKFAVAYLLYPLLEQNFLIGAVSWYAKTFNHILRYYVRYYVRYVH